MRAWFAVGLVVLLAGCQTSGKSEPGSVSAVTDSVSSAVDDLFTSRETIQKEEQAYVARLETQCRVPVAAACSELGDIRSGKKKPGRLKLPEGQPPVGQNNTHPPRVKIRKD